MESDDQISELSKESIRNRMVKNAARIWGVEGEDIESTFDPMVALLIEACAFELYKINNEILDSQTRILERLALLLSPDAFTGPQPSYAIAHARSTEPYWVQPMETQYYANKKILNADQKEINKEIYFSPSIDTKLIDGDIKYLVVGKTIFEYKNASNKSILTETKSNQSLSPSHVYIGLELNQKITSLENIRFFFDWKNNAEKLQYLNLLPLCKWYSQGAECSVRYGLKNFMANPQEDSSFSHFNISKRIEDMVNGVFSKHFAMTGLKVTDECFQLPNEMVEVFSHDNISKIDKKCCWIKIVFPGAMSPSALYDMNISINTFPVINRKLNKIIHQIRNILNIIPLPTDDLFLDVLNIQNSDGVAFKANPLESGFNNESGYYTLRSGGIERFDKRKATDFLRTTIDLLRDESAAFSSLGKEFISTHINQINQAINMIQNRINTKGESSKPVNFVILNNENSKGNIHLNYWTSNGADANLIKAGTKLNMLSGSTIQSNSVLMITTSMGGKSALDEGEKITALKRSILTHDRIVTIQDIEAFCFHEIGDLIKRFEIKKGWSLSLNPKESFIRVLNIEITPNSWQSLTNEEWNNLALELKTKIEIASSSLLPVNIKFIKT